jgi:L,D-transpeptidase catalytic domain
MKQKFFSILLAGFFLFVTGCATFHPFSPQKNLPPACLTTCQRLGLAPTKYIFTVNLAAQRAALFENGKFVRSYHCSTSKFGFGEELDSLRTPRGLHCIAEKIGDGEPAGTIFRNREVAGNVSELGIAAGGICTRIMWLAGLEPGFNCGTNSAGICVDTHTREVYIHGTGNQAAIGKPHSIGCIELADADLIPLYDLLPSGTLVWIAEK